MSYALPVTIEDYWLKCIKYQLYLFSKACFYAEMKGLPQGYVFKSKANYLLDVLTQHLWGRYGAIVCGMWGWLTDLSVDLFASLVSLLRGRVVKAVFVWK